MTVASAILMAIGGIALASALGAASPSANLACSGSPTCNGGPPPLQAVLVGFEVSAPAGSMTCTDPDCIKGVPPLRARLAASVSCPDPKCISGTPPLRDSEPVR